MPMHQTTAQGGEAFKISFIITYYNIPLDMLRQCVESILQLDLQPEEREIILVDDGSPISPKDIVKQYGTAIRYIKQDNQGPAIARNTGLDAAQGRYIQFVDADDYLLKRGFEYCMDLIRRNDDLDIVTIAHTQGQSTAKTFSHTPSMSGAEYMLNYNLCGADWAYLFRQSTMGELRFTPGIVHEDEEFVPQLLLQAKKVVRTTGAAYYYRRREGSIVNKEDSDHLRKRLADFEQVIDNLHLLSLHLSGMPQQALSRRVHQLVMDHLYNVIRLTGSMKAVEETTSRLRQKGLFPLPAFDYTRKYKWFRRISSSRIGRRILLLTLHRQP